MTHRMPPGKPAWIPTDDDVSRCNVTEVAAQLGLEGYAALYRWSIENRADFWSLVAARLGIVFAEPAAEVLGGSAESPLWFAGSRLNIVASCLRHDPDRIALITNATGDVERMTYGELGKRVGRFANGCADAGIGTGDRVAIAMPMTAEAVIAYLGIISAGAVVVSIADSFAAEEIATRLRITGADVVVTQDRIARAGKDLPMYGKVVAAGARRAVVVDTGAGVELREADIRWDDFQSEDDEFEPLAADPGRHTNILFSSGTTGEPKAIPWDQLTPLKAAMDAHFHHDVGPHDVLAWPTNLGWMMGPWLIYAALINGAAFALYDDVPSGRGFVDFVGDAGVTMLGVVPSLVAAWRSTGALRGADWSRIRRFSSTGEASNPDDMAWLMSVSGPKPVIEYCGGTEIGGGYVTGTMVQPAVPSMFSTAALGLELAVLDGEGRPVDSGEVFIVPPSIGLSTELINRDHHEVYYEGTPGGDRLLRRHGDHLERLSGGYYRAQGRIDDTMNLGGIKVSSAEIERVVGAVPGVAEVAAIAVPPPGGGPSRLVVYAVAAEGSGSDADAWTAAMQAAIREHLNPLFKIHDVVACDSLPRTASQKVMRRLLRDEYPDR
jgi:acetyl-CoA synthetase